MHVRSLLAGAGLALVVVAVPVTVVSAASADDGGPASPPAPTAPCAPGVRWEIAGDVAAAVDGSPDLTGLRDDPWKQKALAAATHEALREHPVEAINYARQLEPGGMRTSLLASATAEWARNDPAAAARFRDAVRWVVTTITCMKANR